MEAQNSSLAYQLLEQYQLTPTPSAETCIVSGRKVPTILLQLDGCKNVLRLTLEGGAFDAIRAAPGCRGEKREDFRSINRYWSSRLDNRDYMFIVGYRSVPFFDPAAAHVVTRYEGVERLYNSGVTTAGPYSNGYSKSFCGDVFIIKIGVVVLCESVSTSQSKRVAAAKIVGKNTGKRKHDGKTLEEDDYDNVDDQEPSSRQSSRQPKMDMDVLSKALTATIERQMAGLRTKIDTANGGLSKLQASSETQLTSIRNLTAELGTVKSKLDSTTKDLAAANDLLKNRPFQTPPKLSQEPVRAPGGPPPRGGGTDFGLIQSIEAVPAELPSSRSISLDGVMDGNSQRPEQRSEYRHTPSRHYLVSPTRAINEAFNFNRVLARAEDQIYKRDVQTACLQNQISQIMSLCKH